MAYFPLFLNLKNKEVLVIGSNESAFQEASRFVAFEAKVFVAAPSFDQNLELLQKSYPQFVTLSRVELVMDEIKKLPCSPILVISVSGSESFNNELYDYFQSKNILVQDVSSAARCDFIFPAIVKRGDVVCGISSSGKSPHVSQFIKTILESSVPQNISEINEHMSEIRKAVKQSVSDPQKRRETLQAIFTRLIEDDNQTPDYEIDSIISEAEL